MSIQTTKDRTKFSELRQELVRLAAEVRRLVEAFFSDAPVVAGSVYEMRRKCGKPTCRCAAGEPHARMVISSKEHGKTRLTVVPKESLVEVRIRAGRYRDLRQRRARLVIVLREMVAVMDEMERMRRAEVR